MRTFNGSTQRIQSNVSLDPPGDLCIFCVVRPIAGFGANDRIFSNRLAASGTVGYTLSLGPTASVFGFTIAVGGSWRTAPGSTTPVANTTYRILSQYVAAATDEAYIYVDDGTTPDGSLSGSWGTYNASGDDFTIASEPDITTGLGHWGQIGEVAVWYDNLDVSQRIALLEKNISPEFFPNNRVFYSKLIRGAVDVHGSVLTEVASPGVYPHAPIIYQAQNRVIVPAAPAAGAIMNQLQRRNLGADLFDGTLQ